MGSCSGFASGVLLFFWFVLHGRSGFFDFFCLKASNCFPVKTLFFRGAFIFCTFCLWSWGFEIAPLGGSPVNVIGHTMTSRDYIKIEQVRTYLLSSSLAEFKQFFVWMIFSFLLQLILSWLHGSCSVLALGVLWFFCFVLHGRSGFFGFLVLKFQTVPRWSSFFQKAPHFFVRSVCNHGALKTRLHVVALSSSLAKSEPAEIT